jgi:DNA polymerase (family 10)
LGLSYIPPELREDRGEIEAAEKGALPDLIDLTDIKGILHIHTDASDGVDTIEALFLAAQKMGLQYIGICDHSKSAAYAGGLSEDAIKAQHSLIDTLNKQYGLPYIFKGIESDILPGGSLDYDAALLETFDFVIAAVHSHFSMSEEDMTARLIKALDHPATTILAHPTGRLLLEREPYSVSLEKVIARAAEKGTIIELNANPHRLDLDWRWCKYAKDRGVKIAINPDAHSIEGLGHIRFGINAARKGWLGATDCINCLGLEGIRQVFRLKAEG